MIDVQYAFSMYEIGRLVHEAALARHEKSGDEEPSVHVMFNVDPDAPKGSGLSAVATVTEAP